MQVLFSFDGVCTARVDSKGAIDVLFLAIRDATTSKGRHGCERKGSHGFLYNVES